MEQNKNSNYIPGVSRRPRTATSGSADYLRQISSSSSSSNNTPRVSSNRKWILLGGVFVLVTIILAVVVFVRRGMNSAPDAGGEISADIFNSRLEYKDEINCEAKGEVNYDRVAANDLWKKFTVFGLRDKDGEKTDVYYNGDYVYVAYFDDFANKKTVSYEKSYFDTLDGFERRYDKTISELLSISDEGMLVKCSGQNEEYYRLPYIGAYGNDVNGASAEEGEDE